MAKITKEIVQMLNQAFNDYHNKALSFALNGDIEGFSAYHEAILFDLFPDLNTKNIPIGFRPMKELGIESAKDLIIYNVRIVLSKYFLFLQNPNTETAEILAASILEVTKRDNQLDIKQALKKAATK